MSKQNWFRLISCVAMVIFILTTSLSTSALSRDKAPVFWDFHSQGVYPPLPKVDLTLPEKPSGKASFRLDTLAKSPPLKAADLARQLSLPETGAGSLMRNAQGQVMVYIRMGDLGDAQLQALRHAGATIIHVSSAYQIVTAYIDISALDAVSALPAVTSVQEVLQPLRNGNRPADSPHPAALPAIPNACPWGAARSEGDTQLKADQARSTYNLTGSGVKVGILSDSYNQYSANGITAATDVASGDLPGPGNPCGHATPVNVVMENPDAGGRDEGRAMLQLVHDLAPAATLSFATANGGLYQFADNIRSLRTAGADIIVDDIAYIVEPFFQDGPVSVAIKDVENSGALYFTSAGNSNVIVNNKNVASYEAPAYRPTTCPVAELSGTCHDFDPTATLLNLSGFVLGPGGATSINLQWAESWFGISNDFDLYIFDQSGALAAYSIYDNPQLGLPFEFASIQNSASTAQAFRIMVHHYSGNGTPRLKYIFSNAYNLADVQINTSSGGDIVGPTLFGHSAASAALSVAAVPYNSSTTPENFSSRGPAAHYFAPVEDGSPSNPLPSPEVIQQPDFAATDGGCTTFFYASSGGCYRFFGTSAAAPHAAAVAALLKEKASQHGITLTRALTKSVLQSTAQSMTGGDINSVGKGMLDAKAAIAALPIGPGAFSKSTPANGSNNTATNPALAWGDSSGATRYEYCYDTTNDNVCGGTWTTAGMNTSVNLSGLSNSTTYYWEVRAVNSNGTTFADSNSWWSFTTQANTQQVPAAFGKTSPANGATNQVTTNLALSWQATSPVTKYEYCFSTSTGCTNWTNVGTSTSVTISGLNASTTYYWQVRAWNGTAGPTVANGGTYWNFSTQTGSQQVPAAFGKTSPVNGAANQVTTSLALNWQATSPVTKYEYCFGTNTSCTNWTNAGTSTSVTISGLNTSTTYYWQVRAWNGTAGPTVANSGTYWSFSTGSAPPPTGPRLSIPGNIPARYNATVAVPIHFAANGHSIAATIFSIDFDQNCLAFDPTDSDGDGIPNSVVFSVPAAFTNRSVSFAAGDTDGELDFTIMDWNLPFASLPDGQMATVTFTATCQPTGSSIIAPINFSANPPATFGSTSGQSVAGSTANGSVEIQAGLPGDCNSDQTANAGDLTALVLELFDDDGDNPANAPNGTFAGNPIGCNANGDQSINAGDLTCTVLLIFNGPGACGGSRTNSFSYFGRTPERGARLFSAAPRVVTANPALTITNNVPALSGSTVVVPVLFASNGNNIASTVFSIDFDQAWLSLDPADRNDDRIPDAIQVNVPPAFLSGTSVSFDAADTNGEIDFVIADFNLPLGSLSNGTLISITFRTGSPTTMQTAAVNFSADPPVSFGNTQGQGMPGTLKNGSIVIKPPRKVFLPVIVQH